MISTSWRHCIVPPRVVPLLSIWLCLLPLAASATDVNVVGLFSGKAVVSINGAAPRTLSAGQKSPEGVTLISSDSESATLEIDGRKQTLRMGQAYKAPQNNASAQSITLAADTRGHFVVEGQINGGAVRFVVDTGATMIALSAADAQRLGIDYRKGRPGPISTANGNTTAWRVMLDTVRIGAITVNNVEAAVLENSLPIALLGMSFLNRMEMRRDGEMMVLTKRY